MTDTRARAEMMVEDWYTMHDDIKANVAQRRELIGCIERALANERRQALEEAAKLMCSYCNDPHWPRSVIVQGQAVHVGPITGSVFPCNAMQIHVALLAQAQAGPEEGK